MSQLRACSIQNRRRTYSNYYIDSVASCCCRNEIDATGAHNPPEWLPLRLCLSEEIPYGAQGMHLLNSCLSKRTPREIPQFSARANQSRSLSFHSFFVAAAIDQLAALTIPRRLEIETVYLPRLQGPGRLA